VDPRTDLAVLASDRECNFAPVNASCTGETVDLEVFDIKVDLDSVTFRAKEDLIVGNQTFPLQSLFEITAFVNVLKELPEKYASSEESVGH
jgi:hypothetical protein